MQIYKLNETYYVLKTKLKKGGVFQICDKDGNIKPPIKKNGLIIDHGGRIFIKNYDKLESV
jgi:hypothetical protein